MKWLLPVPKEVQVCGSAFSFRERTLHEREGFIEAGRELFRDDGFFGCELGLPNGVGEFDDEVLGTDLLRQIEELCERGAALRGRRSALFTFRTGDHSSK